MVLIVLGPPLLSHFDVIFPNLCHHSDIAYYGINLNQSVILAQIGYSTAPTVYGRLWNTAVGNLIAQSAGYLPGFFVGIFLPDWIGRRTQQLLGCAGAMILYAIWAGVTNHTSTAGLMTVFTISQLVLNSGPNVTTFLIPVELFPTRVRATAHGLAAASGKLGAVLTAFTFGSLTESIGIEGVLGLLSGIMFLTTALTFLIPETKGRTIEDLETDVLYTKADNHTPTKLGSPELRGSLKEDIAKS
jgi:PHS family inorganic phosphate transporter-like MFS transporter